MARLDLWRMEPMLRMAASLGPPYFFDLFISSDGIPAHSHGGKAGADKTGNLPHLEPTDQ